MLFYITFDYLNSRLLTENFRFALKKLGLYGPLIVLNNRDEDIDQNNCDCVFFCSPCTLCIFSYSSSFPIKMLATIVKTQKILPDLNFFMTDEGHVNMIDTT